MIKAYARKTLYYINRCILGIKALFYILIGGRGCGKTYSTQNYCLRKFFKHGELFIWFRLTEASAQKLLQRNAADFIDSKLIEKWKITSITTQNDLVFINGKEAARILPLSTFYSSKGVALNKSGKMQVKDKQLTETESAKKISRAIKKYRTLVLDEMNREKNEKKTFDISYAFVNQLENICRLDTDRRIFLLGNSLEEASDIMAGCFNFIPNELGIYKLKRKNAVIHYIEDSEEYKKARSKSIAGMLMPEESTFTNVIKSDMALIQQRAIPKPTAIIRFSNTKYFTLCGTIITQYKQQNTSKLPVYAMVPYLSGIPYYKDQAKKIIDMAQQRLFKFDQLLTLKLFYKEIKQVKGG